MILKRFDKLTLEELYAILVLRSEVFVVEQHCPYLDPDGKDQDSWHLFIMEGGRCIAYARLIPPGISYPEASIGRVVTAMAARNKGYGIRIMNEAILQVKELFNTTKVRISAQAYLKDFYESLGFQQDGEGYLEDDIPHLPMVLSIN